MRKQKNSPFTTRILICGYGNIGKHMKNELDGAGTIQIYDKFMPEYSSVDSWITYDFAFVCVPTNMLPDGSADTSIVREVCETIRAKTIVIKSAVPVGTTEKLSKLRRDVNFVISPEYYGTTIHSSDSPNFLILGGDKSVCSKVAELYYRVKPCTFRIKFTDYRTAELAKYMENCFLATKVTFCNEFAKIANKFGINYPELREIFVMDERMGGSHTYVFPEQPYYDSHCLNKDIPALIQQAGEDAPLMSAVNEINRKAKEKAAE